MDVITYSHARAHLAEVMDKVCDDRAPTIVSRRQNRAVVMISLEEWNAMQETLHLMSSPRNAQRLLEAVEELNAGRGTERKLVES